MIALPLCVCVCVCVCGPCITSQVKQLLNLFILQTSNRVRVIQAYFGGIPTDFDVLSILTGERGEMRYSWKSTAIENPPNNIHTVYTFCLTFNEHIFLISICLRNFLEIHQHVEHTNSNEGKNEKKSKNKNRTRKFAHKKFQ